MDMILSPLGFMPPFSTMMESNMSTEAKPTSPSYQQPKRESSKATQSTQVAAEKLQEYGSHYVGDPARDIGSQLVDYAKRKPDVAAIWCFGLGVILGWKLRG